jgi:hypothetical protein
VLLRLAYLGVTNALAMLRLLPMSDRDKDAEILALRHQITVLERQLGKQKPRFDPTNRVLLAALLHPLPTQALRSLRLLVRPDTILRVAPRPDRPPPREGLPPQAALPAPNTALDPSPSAAPGKGKRQLGLPTRARRTPRAGREGRCVYGLGDPPRPESTRRPNGPPPPGRTSCVPRPMLCWSVTSWRRSR